MNVKRIFLTGLVVELLLLTAGAQEVLPEPTILFQEVEALEVQNGQINRTTDWVDLPNPLVTRAALTLTIQSDNEFASAAESVLVQVALDGGAPLVITKISPGDTWPNEAQLETSFLGELAQASFKATRARFEVIVSVGEDTKVEIGSLRLEESGVVFDGPLRSVPAKADFKVELINPANGKIARELVLTDNAAESLPFQVRYVPKEGESIDLKSLGNDDICLGDLRSDFIDHDFGAHFVNAVDEGDGKLLANYEIRRPEGGWRQLRFFQMARAYVCYKGVQTSTGGQRAPSLTLFGDAEPGFLGYFKFGDQVPLGEAEVLGEPAVTSRDQPFIDVDIAMDKSIFDADTLGDGDARLHIRRDEIEGVLQSTRQGEEPNFIATFRFNRPSYGWHSETAYVHLSQHRESYTLTEFTFGGSLFGYSAGVGSSRPIGSVEAPKFDFVSYEVVPLAIDPAASRFEVDVVFTGANPIDISTVGDGDLEITDLFSDRKQPGKFIKAEVMAGDRHRVRATFEFQRDPGAWLFSNLYSRAINGAVFDEMGNPSFGRTPGADFSGLRLRTRNVQGDFQTGFIPLSQYQDDLAEFHFRVIFRSGEPIDSSDFEATSPIRAWAKSVEVDGMTYEGKLFPTLQSWRLSESDRVLEADYVLGRPEQGWPRNLSLSVINYSMRDVTGRTNWNPKSRAFGIPLADLGPGFEDGLEVTMLGGQVVDDSADKHRIELLVQAGDRLAEDLFNDSQLWFGWHPELIPGLEAFDVPAPINGRLAKFVTVNNNDPDEIAQGNLAVVTYEIDRPANGWSAWDAGRVPFVLQSVKDAIRSSNLVEPLPFIGYVRVVNAPRALPLLYSFEDWIREFEKKAEVPEGSLSADADGDGQEGVLEYALGSDPTDGQDTAEIKSEIIAKAEGRFVRLNVPIRPNTIGVTLEIQHSTDGSEWRPARDHFKLIERLSNKDGQQDHLILQSKEPLPDVVKLGLFRAIIAR